MDEQRAFIELNPWRRKTSFGVEIVKARFRIDGAAEALLHQWTPTRVAVAPGRHRVEMWIRWGIYQHMGRNSIDVDVPPDGVRVRWCVPTIAFTKGRMEVTAPGELSDLKPGATWGYDLPAAPAPPAVPVASAVAPPAGWNPDPSGRHEYRYWDGRLWTAAVADGGVTAEDPLPS